MRKMAEALGDPGLVDHLLEIEDLNEEQKIAETELIEKEMLAAAVDGVGEEGAQIYNMGTTTADASSFDTLKRATFGLMRGGAGGAGAGGVGEPMSGAGDGAGAGGTAAAVDERGFVSHGEAANYLAAISGAVLTMPPAQLSASLEYVLFPVNQAGF